MEGIFRQILNSKSKTFLAFCFCFLFGTVIASLYVDTRISGPAIFGVGLACIGLVSIFWGNVQARFILLCCSIIVFACFRYSFAFPTFTHDTEKTFDTKQTVIGTITTEPDRRIDKTNYIVETKEYGPMFVEGTRYPERKYGEVYELYCTIKKPEASDDFRYDMYLARQGIFAICDRGVFGEQVGNDGNVLFTGVLTLKSVVADRINRLWHEPYASFVAGILYGYRGGLGSLNEDFSRTGVTHIVAVSGFNITIIATVLMTIITRFFLPRRKAFWVVVLGVIVFVVFTGMSASVVRAGIMGIITLVAYQMGRLSRIGNTLAATAVAMTLHNPFVLMWDAGFQLSFISTMGLVYVSPLLENMLRFKTKDIPIIDVGAVMLRESFLSTMAAIIATLPLILSQFGRLSLVAPIVNVLILWTIPFLMLFSFIAVLVSFVFYPLAAVIAWMTWVGLAYVVEVVQWFSSLSFAAVDVRVPSVVMLLLYGVMLYCIMRKK